MPQAGPYVKMGRENCSPSRRHVVIANLLLKYNLQNRKRTEKSLVPGSTGYLLPEVIYEYVIGCTIIHRLCRSARFYPLRLSLSAAVTVLDINMAIVIGPIPPGTGVI